MYPPQSTRTIGVRACEHDADGPGTIRIGRRIERDVDGRPAVPDRGFGRQREETTVQQQVIVRGRNVENATLDWRLVLHFDDDERRPLLQERAQQIIRLPVPVLNEDDGNGEIRGQAAHQLAESVQPSP